MSPFYVETGVHVYVCAKYMAYVSGMCVYGMYGCGVCVVCVSVWYVCVWYVCVVCVWFV